MKKKKLLSLFSAAALSLSVLCSAFPVSVAAADAPVVKAVASKTTVEPGDEFTISFDLTSNPGMEAFGMQMEEYDTTAFEYVGVLLDNLEGRALSNLMPLDLDGGDPDDPVDPDVGKPPYKERTSPSFMWLSMMGRTDRTTGVIAVLKFKVLDTAVDGTTYDFNINALTRLIKISDGTKFDEDFPLEGTSITVANTNKIATLDSLSVKDYAFKEGAFKPGTFAYTVDIPYDVNISDLVVDYKATAPANAAKPVIDGNKITITVTSKDGSTKNDYVITVNQMKDPNATISNISVNVAGTLEPAFSAKVTNYTYTVKYEDWMKATNFEVKGTAGGKATVTNPAAKPITNVDKDNGKEEVFEILVTSEDGEEEVTYTVTVKVLGCPHEKWTETETLAPKCVATGLMDRKCDLCAKEEKDVEIPALDHEWATTKTAVAPTCTEDGEEYFACTRENCDDKANAKKDIVVTDKLGHKWGEWTADETGTVYTRTCANDPTHTETQQVPAAEDGHTHSFTVVVTDDPRAVAPTCIKEGIEIVKCSHEGCEETIWQTKPTVAHTPVADPSKTVAATCTAEGHEYSVCFECNKIITDAPIAKIAHNFADGKCTVCGTKDPDYVAPVDPSQPSGPNEADIEWTTGNRPAPAPGTAAPAGAGTSTDTSSASASSDSVIAEITAASNGDVVDVKLSGNSTEVAKALIEAIAGKDITVKFTLSNGAYWEVNGTNIETAKNVDLGVKMNTKNIPSKKISELAGKKNTIQFSLNNNGTFGFTGVLNIPVDAKYNGKYANLYYYNNGDFEFIGSSAINGAYTRFRFSHASDYVIVIDDYAYGDDVSSAAGISDSTMSTVIPYASLLILTIIIGTSVVVIRKRSINK